MTMKNLIKNLLILFSASFALLGNNLQAQTPLTEAVDFHVKTPDGTTIFLFPLLDDEDKIVVIDFFSTGCGYCQTYAPDFQTSYEDFGENEGNVYFMKINWGSDNAAVMAFDSTYGLTMPTVSGTQGGGNQVFNDYQILSYPTVIVITPDHNIFNQYIWPPDAQTIDSVVLAAGGIMTGQREFAANDRFRLYPVPAHNSLTVSAANLPAAVFEYDITNMNGMIVQKRSIWKSGRPGGISLTGLKKGQYFLRIYRNGTVYAVKPFIKE